MNEGWILINHDASRFVHFFSSTSTNSGLKFKSLINFELLHTQSTVTKLRDNLKRGKYLQIIHVIRG